MEQKEKLSPEEVKERIKNILSGKEPVREKKDTDRIYYKKPSIIIQSKKSA